MINKSSVVTGRTNIFCFINKKEKGEATEFESSSALHSSYESYTITNAQTYFLLLKEAHFTNMVSGQSDHLNSENYLQKTDDIYL